MMKKVLFMAAAIGAVAAAPASAVTVIAEQGTLANFSRNYPGLASTTFDFNSGNTTTEANKITGAGFTFNGSSGTFGVRTGSSQGQWQQPTPGDASSYASVQNNSTLKIFTSNAASRGYDLISLYLGSVDDYNSISVLNTAGVAIATYTGQQLLNFAVPAGTANGTTSYRITFTRSAGDVAFGGLSVTSNRDNAAEFDNLVFAVPEPSTWALMLAGFGMVGMAMRARRRRTSVVFG
ncbi:hypothetical protein GCM10011380_28190 [Sphingomonas metalli]|uniref:Ice-binding protein C-terminal domain-containing protein n=1 Tax=Sphingomonas metalli TaxID=1779358 RepID=A0A916TC91_9SPHN|nr:PEPxxWA-CTERM sorting domain-containing protein [Sphingomonas metalli]GGB37145.1 hypothetical protein GCM10011380_28190 [Sphingomonas metalli]